MTRGPGSSPIAAPLRVFAVMLAGMVVVPAIRPLFAARGASESAMHMFMSVNMLGAVIATPFLAFRADRSGHRERYLAALTLADAALVALSASPISLWLVMMARTLQGAANVTALSLAMTDQEGDADSSRLASRARRGAAMMAAIVVGPPLGGALLVLGPRAPFFAAAAAASIAFVVGLPRLASPSSATAPRPERSGFLATLRAAPFLVVPATIAFVERFTVGCFVVTFALRANHVLGMNDRQISLGYSLFLVPFALAMYPATVLMRRFRRSTLLAAGTAAYGLSLGLVGVSSGPWLVVALVAAGLGSAAMYAPALGYAATLSPRGAPSTGMALFHAAGCMGMMLGPAVAGITSATLRHAGTSDAVRYATVFGVAATSLFVALAALRPRLVTLRSHDGVVDSTPSAVAWPHPSRTPSTFPAGPRQA